jgi:hypothetical protein
VRGDGPEDESLSQAERMVEGRSGGCVSKWIDGGCLGVVGVGDLRMLPAPPRPYGMHASSGVCAVILVCGVEWVVCGERLGS